MLPAAFRNCPTYSPPVAYQEPIKPANSPRSPMPLVILIEKKNGLSSISGAISIQVRSSFCQIGRKPGTCFASLITSAKGRGAPGAGGGAAGAGGLAAVDALGAPGGAGVGAGVAAGAGADGIAEAAGAGVALRASLAAGCIVAHADSIAANSPTETMPKRDAPCA